MHDTWGLATSNFIDIKMIHDTGDYSSINDISFGFKNFPPQIFGTTDLGSNFHENDTEIHRCK